MGAVGNLLGGLDELGQAEFGKGLLSGMKEYNKLQADNAAIRKQHNVGRGAIHGGTGQAAMEDEIEVQDRMTSSQLSSVAMFKRMAAGYRTVKEATGVTSQATEHYIKMIEEEKNLTEEQVAMLRLRSEAELKMLGNQAKLSSAAKDANAQFEQSFHPLTQYQKQMKTIDASIEMQSCD